MPEGDTLRILATRINDRLAGRRVERSIMRDPRLAGRDLAGSTLVGADAYGKHLFVRFDDGRTLHAHLNMEGAFVVSRRSTVPEWKRRVELHLADGGSLVGVSVPVLGLMATDDEHRVTDRLGPDLCAPDAAPDPAVVAARLVADPARPLSGAMLDQELVAGWGNVYANDVPFICGVSPHQSVGAIDGIGALAAVGTALIRTNAQLGHQNTVGKRLGTDATWIHGRGRRPCPVCGERLRYRAGRETPWGRSITWCEACQPVGAALADLGRVRRLIGLHPAARGAAFLR